MNSAAQSSVHKSISDLLQAKSLVTLQDVINELCLDSPLQAKKILTEYTFTVGKKINGLRTLFMIEKEQEGTLQYQLVTEGELAAIIQNGEKVNNAYIYAVASDQSDLDKELFNIERLQRSFDLFSPTIVFDHHQDVHHQNFKSRKSGQNLIKTSNPPQPVVKQQPAGPFFKQEIKKNDTSKPPQPAKSVVTESTAAAAAKKGDDKKQSTLFTVPSGGVAAKAAPMQVESASSESTPPQIATMKLDDEPPVLSVESKSKVEAKEEPPKIEKEFKEEKQTEDEEYENENIQNSGGKNKRRLKRNINSSDEVDEEPKPKKSTANKKKRSAILNDSDDEAENGLDVKDVPVVAKENKNFFNKTQATSQVEQPHTIAGRVLPPGKGLRKVKKTRTTFDEKGYMVNEDYSSYEEYDIPTRDMIKKDPIKKVGNQINLMPTQQQTQPLKVAGSKGGPAQVAEPGKKAQATLGSFFKK